MHDGDKHTADQWHDHMDRLRRIVRRFLDGEITPTEKRRAIAAENAVYYGPDFKSPATGELITRPPRIRKHEPSF